MWQMRMPKTRYGKQFDALQERFSRDELVRQISGAILEMRFQTMMLQSEVAESIGTSGTMISLLERAVVKHVRWDALECIAHNLRYDLVLDRRVRVRKKKSWRAKKRSPKEAGRGLWSAMVRKGTPRAAYFS